MLIKQLALPVPTTLKHIEGEGIPMGVLHDGTPYLTARGLARVCGINHTSLIKFAINWDEEQRKPRGKRISELLSEQRFDRDYLYLELTRDGQKIQAYTDDVCMAILEYYAFDSTQGANDIALKNYRILARHGLRSFIYNKVGYDPKNRIPETWKHYHDRVMLNDLPKGYFNVFREIADIVIYAIQKGLIVDSHTIPDISVGQFWSKYWQENNFTKKYGERLKYNLPYPDYFPQAKSNYAILPYIYPILALGEFRVWMQKIYLPENFPGYLNRKVKQGLLPASSVELLLEAIEQKPKEL